MERFAEGLLLFAAFSAGLMVGTALDFSDGKGQKTNVTVPVGEIYLPGGVDATGTYQLIPVDRNGFVVCAPDRED